MDTLEKWGTIFFVVIAIIFCIATFWFLTFTEKNQKKHNIDNVQSINREHNHQKGKRGG